MYQQKGGIFCSFVACDLNLLTLVMGISSAEFSKIWEGDTKCDFQLEMPLSKTFAEVANALSRDCGVKPALRDAESHSWPSCWMVVCPQTSFVYTGPKSALNRAN